MIGFSIGKKIKQTKPDVQASSFAQGFHDAIEGKDSRLTKEDIKQARIEALKNSLKKKPRKDSNMKEQKDFLEKNKQKPSVKTTSSGLQYEVLQEGTGKSPELTNKVEVHYKGSLIDGTEFDSSYKRGEPISFPLSGVIKGWQEGLQLMKEGAKYKLYIPSEIGYGSAGAGASIPPHATLIFEVELLKVL